MMSKPWFDPDSGAMLFDDYVVELASYQKVVEDRRITDAELAEQAHKVASLLRKLESLLPANAKAAATEALCELAVLNTLQIRRAESRR